MKKPWVILLLVFVLGGAAVAAILGKQFLNKRAEVVRVTMSKAAQKDLVSRVSAPGRVQATTSVDISAEVPGRIVELLVAEGDVVERGDLLLRLDDARYRSQVQQTQASLRTATANLELSTARAEKAQKDLVRLERMLEASLASEEAVERARTDLRVLQAEVEARKQERNRTQAALEVSRDDLAKTKYLAPLAGRIARLNVEEGENVIVGTMNNPGTIILSIANLAQMEVEAEVDETDVVSVKPNQPAIIEVDAIPETEFKGRVSTVGNSGRGQARGSIDESVNFEVVIQFDQSDDRLRPGMTAEVDIETETRDNALCVPIQALVARSRGVLEDERIENEGNKDKDDDEAELSDEEKERRREVLEGVFKVIDGKAVFTEVEVGIADNAWIEVSGDLQPDDQIVSGPYRVLRNLKEGASVKERRKKSKDTAGA